MSEKEPQEMSEEEFQTKVLFYFNAFKDNVANTMLSINSVITEDLKNDFTEHYVKRVVFELLLHFSAINAIDCLLNIVKEKRETILDNYIQNIISRLIEEEKSREESSTNTTLDVVDEDSN